MCVIVSVFVKDPKSEFTAEIDAPLYEKDVKHKTSLGSA